MKVDAECSQGLESSKVFSAADQGVEELYGLAEEEAEMPGVRLGLGSRMNGRLVGMGPWSERAGRG